MKRRNFIKQTATATAASIVVGGGILLLGSRDGQSNDQLDIYKPKAWRVPLDPNRPVLAAAKGKDWRLATAAAIGALGGIETFIKAGDIVCIKPNIGWDRTPQLGANTHPDVVAELIHLCLAAGAGKVIVVDVTCNDSNRTYNRSGIKAASEAEGAEVIIAGDSHYAKVDFGTESLGLWKVLKPILECDKLINVPVVKHHSLSGMTAGMKNWFGAITGPRNLLHQNINENIAELGRLFQPTLTVEDATRVLQRNGPTGGRVDDVNTYDSVIASTDQVAADSYVTRYLSLNPDKFPYLGMAEEMGLGLITPPPDKIAEIEV
ncbi:MAG: DUF362 domain-containing protein [candidate division Zixibacteria bacterium]|nr:DUF362 domain-containing protein [candidate division Zixibacteria bacterium]